MAASPDELVPLVINAESTSAPVSYYDSLSTNEDPNPNANANGTEDPDVNASPVEQHHRQETDLSEVKYDPRPTLDIPNNLAGVNPNPDVHHQHHSEPRFPALRHLQQRVKNRASSKCFCCLLVSLIAFFIVVIVGLGTGVALTYSHCIDLNIVKDIYSNTTILAASGITTECNNAFTISSVSTDSDDYIDQELLFYISPCASLEPYEIHYDEQYITLTNWTFPLRLFDNAYWAMGTAMTFDVNASVLAGQSSKVYICIFDNVQYFTQFIDTGNRLQDVAKFALNCSIGTVDSVNSTPAGTLQFNVSQPGYFYVGLRPTTNLATLDIHMYGSQFYFNRTEYSSTNCSVAWEQPCTFEFPASSTGSEQCVVAYAVPLEDISRGYTSILFESPKPKGLFSVFIGTSAGLGSVTAVVFLVSILFIILYLMLPACIHNT